MRHGITPSSTTKKGNYNPDLAAALFGAQGELKVEDLDSEKKFCLGVFRNGIWEQRKTDIGVFRHKKHDINIPYLNTDAEPYFQFDLPKVPAGILYGVVDFFKLVMDKFKGSEVMVQIFWNKESSSYEIFVPTQRVSGASISFDHDATMLEDPNRIWVIDIHSHNSMAAFFSGGDNNDEKSTRLFGVIGHLNRSEWASKWRAGSNGHYYDLELNDIWDYSDTRKRVIPETALMRVSERSFSRNTSTHKPSTVQHGKPSVPNYGKGVNWNNWQNWDWGSAYSPGAMQQYGASDDMPDSLFYNLSREQYNNFHQRGARVKESIDEIIDNLNWDMYSDQDIKVLMSELEQFFVQIDGVTGSSLFKVIVDHFWTELSDEELTEALSEFIDFQEGV